MCLLIILTKILSIGCVSPSCTIHAHEQLPDDSHGDGLEVGVGGWLVVGRKSCTPLYTPTHPTGVQWVACREIGLVVGTR